MNRYLTMWEKVKELTPEQKKDWINAVTPATGMTIDFRGVRVVDAYVLEALRNSD